MADDMDDTASLVVDESRISTTMGKSTASKKASANGLKAFMTYDQRLTSFSQVLTRKRTSTAKGGKTMKLEWPSENPSPEKMAEAGFYFKPTVKAPDQVACFLCQKFLDGWEPTDDPREEHRVHSPECGWAICKCTRKSLNEDPQSEALTLARIMTFAKWWPHDGKKGWRAKTESLATAGFIYAPRHENDDRVICLYCNTEVDGWEPKDSPREFHQGEKPDCPFFNFGIVKSAPVVAASETVDAIDETENEDEPATTKSKAKPKKRASKVATTKKRTTALKKAKSMQSEEEHEDYENMVLRDGVMDDTDVEETQKAPKNAPKGRKRKSSAMDAEEKENRPLYNQDALSAKVLERQLQRLQDVEEAKASPVKRRMTRASLAAKESRFSLNVSVPSHLVQSSDDEAALKSLKNSPVKKSKKAGGKKASAAKSRTASRKASATIAPPAPVIMAGMDDDEIDKALELDLQRPLSDEEDGGAKLNAELEAYVSPIVSPVISKAESPEAPKPKGRRRLTRTKPSRDSELSEVEVQLSTKPKKRSTRTKPRSNTLTSDDGSETDQTTVRQSSKAKPTYPADSRRSSRATAPAPAHIPIVKSNRKKATRALKQEVSTSEHEIIDTEAEELAPVAPPRLAKDEVEADAAGDGDDDDDDDAKEKSIVVSPPQQEVVEDVIVVSPRAEQPSEEFIEDAVIVSPAVSLKSVREASPQPEAVNFEEETSMHHAAPDNVDHHDVEQPEEKPKKKGKKGPRAAKTATREEIPPSPPSTPPVEEISQEAENPDVEQIETAEELPKKPKKGNKKGPKSKKAQAKSDAPENVEAAEEVSETQQIQNTGKDIEEQANESAKRNSKIAPEAIEQEEEPVVVVEDAEKEPPKRPRGRPSKTTIIENQETENEVKPRRGRPSRITTPAETQESEKEPKRPRGRPSKTKASTKKSISPVKKAEPAPRQSLKRKSSRELISPKSAKAPMTRMLTFDIEISPLKDSIGGPIDPADISDLQVSELHGSSDIQMSAFHVSELQDKDEHIEDDGVEITEEAKISGPLEQDDVEIAEEAESPQPTPPPAEQDVEISEPDEPAPPPSIKKSPAKKKRGEKKQQSLSFTRQSDTTNVADAPVESQEDSFTFQPEKVERASTRSKRGSQRTSKKPEPLEEKAISDIPPSPASKPSQMSQDSQMSSSPQSVLNTQFTDDVSGRETQLTQYTEPSQPSPKKGVSFAEQLEIDQQIQSEIELSFRAEQSRLSGDGGYDEEVSSEFEELNNDNYNNDTSSRRTPLSASKENSSSGNFAIFATPSSRQQLVLRDDGKALASTRPYDPTSLDSLVRFQDENKPPLSSSLSQEERKMTVAQWIKANAIQSEMRVLRVCENVVAAFEEQGKRAIASVEGIPVHDDY